MASTCVRRLRLPPACVYAVPSTVAMLKPPSMVSRLIVPLLSPVCVLVQSSKVRGIIFLCSAFTVFFTLHFGSVVTFF